MLLYKFSSLFALFIGNKDILDGAFVRNRVNVKHALVTLGNDWLKWNEVKKLNLSLKLFCNRDQLLIFAVA